MTEFSGAIDNPNLDGNTIFLEFEESKKIFIFQDSIFSNSELMIKF